MLTRAEVFHRLDGFDERLAGVLGDADYCLPCIRLWATSRFTMLMPCCFIAGVGSADRRGVPWPSIQRSYAISATATARHREG